MPSPIAFRSAAALAFLAFVAGIVAALATG
jgi:hypothetical protein